MSSLCDRRVLVTGGGGFLGREVCRQLEAFQPAEVVAPRSREYDLRDRDAIGQMLTSLQPQVVIHLAAVVGGIGANRRHPGKYFYENAIMGIELIWTVGSPGAPSKALGYFCYHQLPDLFFHHS